MAQSRLLSSKNPNVQQQVRMFKRDYDVVVVPAGANYYSPYILGYAGRGTLVIFVHCTVAVDLSVQQGADVKILEGTGAGSYFICVPWVTDNGRVNFYNPGGADGDLVGSIAIVPGLSSFALFLAD